ncbi:MAG TPA: Rne/Rng family ribonuclease [Humibacillus xanthopallidus]|nr:Rne/Rng family ribonuclease [Humibacillus xanthopallidus]
MAPNDTTPTSTDAGDSTLFAASSGEPAEGQAPAAKARAPRKRAAVKRTTKKAAAAPASADLPSGEATADAPAAEALAGDQTDRAGEVAGDEADATAAPAAKKVAKRAPRKRTSRAKTAPEASPAASSESTEPADRAAAALEELLAQQAVSSDETAETADAGETAEASEISQTVTLDGLIDTEAVVDADEVGSATSADLADEDEDEAGRAADRASAAPVVPSLSLLFQAPEPTPTRRRRSAVRDAGPVAPAGAAPRSTPDLDAEVADPEPIEHVEDVEELEPETTSPLADDEESTPRRSRRRRGGKGRRGRGSSDTDDENGDDTSVESAADASDDSDSGRDDQDDQRAEESHEGDHPEGGDEESATSRRRRRRRRAGSSADAGDDTPSVSTRVRQPRTVSDEPTGVKGSTRLEAKKQRRREGREAGRRRTVITEAEFLARREAVDRVMVVRNRQGRTQMGVLEDGVLVEHYIDQATNVSMAGNIYLGRVQNVLPSMEAAFVDIGKGRNAVLYAGEVNWDAAGLEVGQPKRIENALSSGQTVLVQVTKDPIGHKGARLTSQISLPGRYLVYVPNASMTGISRKLPDTERARLKKILRDVVPDSAGVIVRTAAEGASEEELRADVERLTSTWEQIQAQAEMSATPRAGKSKGRKKNGSTGSAVTGTAPMLLHGEPDLTVRVIRDVFNEDFKQLVVQGDQAWDEIHPYITSVAPDLADRLTKWTSEEDLFTHHRVDEQLAKAMDRKVWLPSGGSLVIDRTEAMTVVDVNTGKFVGSGGNLEETVTKNNIEAAEEIVRQLRLRDIGGIIVIDFIDMVLESNRDLVVRRLLECLGRDRTKHQVAEVTSLGLVQMTRKRVGSGLIEVFSETCQHCNGRGFIIHTDPVDRGVNQPEVHTEPSSSGRRRGGRGSSAPAQGSGGDASHASGNGRGNGGNGGNGRAEGSAEPPRHTGPTAAQIAAAAHAAALKTAAALDDGHPHAFPEDNGPWAGDEAPAVPSQDDAPAVELESDVTEATTSQPEHEHEHAEHEQIEAEHHEHAEQHTEPEVTAEVVSEAPVEVEVVVEPAPRGRRRRGRVVAPAGPPRGSAAGGDGGDA